MDWPNIMCLLLTLSKLMICIDDVIDYDVINYDVINYCVIDCDVINYYFIIL